MVLNKIKLIYHTNFKKYFMSIVAVIPTIYLSTLSILFEIKIIRIKKIALEKVQFL